MNGGVSTFAHPTDHGVRVFDPALASATTLGRAHFDLRRTPDGRYYAYLEIDTALGHVCAAVHLEGRHAQSLAAAETTGASDAPINLAARAVLAEIERGPGISQRISRTVRHFQRAYNRFVTPFTGDYVLVEDGIFGPKTQAAIGHIIENWSDGAQGETLTGAADDAIAAIADAAAAARQALDAAAAAQNLAPEVLAAAKQIVRAHMGDESARAALRAVLDAARAGDPDAKRRVRVFAAARRFARSVLGAIPSTSGLQQTIGTTTGSLFGDLGHALGHAVKSISHDVAHVEHAIGKVVGPVIKEIKKWGPMILSDIQGLVAFIPGIGTGISAALSAAEAIFKGGGLLSIAIHMAYGCIPIPPGLKNVTDIVLDAVMEFVKNRHHFVDSVIATVRDRIPSGLPREVFDTLIKIIVKRQPVLKAVGGALGHYVGQYTAGIGPTIAHGLSQVAPEIQGIVGKLPPANTVFKSIHEIAPHFTVSPAAIPGLLAHAQAAAGVALDPAHAAALTQGVASAMVLHAQAQAALRLAQRTHVTPHEPPTPAAPGANLGVQASPDGSAQRVVASSALAHLIPQVSVPHHLTAALAT